MDKTPNGGERASETKTPKPLKRARLHETPMKSKRAMDVKTSIVAEAMMQPHEIRKERNRHGLSVPECARMVKVSDRTWRRWEDGTRTMPLGAWELFQLKLHQDSGEEAA